MGNMSQSLCKCFLVLQTFKLFSLVSHFSESWSSCVLNRLLFTVIVAKHLSLLAQRILYPLQLQSDPVGDCSFHVSFTPRC